jgi:aryl-alcohol dehydrogenase-like predicted oxidoreductase
MSIKSKTIHLGRTNLDVSPICFGSWQLSERFWGDVPARNVTDAVHRALEVGVNFFDTADAYGDGRSERVLGQALGDTPRDQYVLATKVFWNLEDGSPRYPDLSRKYILWECEQSLQRLGLDHIDLYQAHAWDPLTPMDDIVEAFEQLVTDGKIRAYGVSNWSVEQLRLGHARGGQFASCQPFYSLLDREIENDLLPYCQSEDIGVLVYSPLHRGLLTGKYDGSETFEDARRDHPDFQGERFAELAGRVAKLQEIADGYGLSTVQLVLTATLMHPGIECAIVGIKKPAHIEEAAGALDTQISREDFFTVRNLVASPSISK